jgi:hypothetical protein
MDIKTLLENLDNINEAARGIKVPPIKAPSYISIVEKLATRYAQDYFDGSNNPSAGVRRDIDTLNNYIGLDGSKLIDDVKAALPKMMKKLSGNPNANWDSENF